MPQTVLLTRDDFRNQVFKRDHWKCVICGTTAKDAHHIIERRLFPNGGYYLSNGASLCETHHRLAESTELSCEEIREAAGITDVILPEDMYADTRYDKWGNPYNASGLRYYGPLFFDPSVRKILKGEFSPYVKYPRTYHLPWSSGTKDDRILNNIDHFIGQEVVITEKMDGENTNMYSDYIHARSLDYSSHPSRDRIKSLHSTVCGEIPFGYRVCGENLYAKHSIEYDDLEDFFLVFSVWCFDECLSWQETVEWADLLNLKTVPVLWQGTVESAAMLKRITSSLDFREGYVVRLLNSYKLKDFSKAVAKFVRPNHVTTSHHWRFERVVPNRLKGA